MFIITRLNVIHHHQTDCSNIYHTSRLLSPVTVMSHPRCDDWAKRSVVLASPQVRHFTLELGYPGCLSAVRKMQYRTRSFCFSPYSFSRWSAHALLEHDGQKIWMFCELWFFVGEEVGEGGAPDRENGRKWSRNQVTGDPRYGLMAVRG
jgi:hypothetical protein